MMDQFGTSVAEFVRHLGTADWVWKTDTFAEAAETSGWTLDKVVVKGVIHRVTYTRPDDWTWTIYSKNGLVYWSDTRIKQSEWPAVKSQPIADVVVSAFLTEYYVLLELVRDALGRELFEGDSRDPGYPTKHDTRRIAQWTCGNGILSLGLFQIDVTLPLWLAIMLEPASVYRNR
jgi:hypothetical protein